MTNCNIWNALILEFISIIVSINLEDHSKIWSIVKNLHSSHRPSYIFQLFKKVSIELFLLEHVLYYEFVFKIMIEIPWYWWFVLSNKHVLMSKNILSLWKSDTLLFLLMVYNSNLSLLLLIYSLIYINVCIQ